MSTLLSLLAAMIAAPVDAVAAILRAGATAGWLPATCAHTFMARAVVGVLIVAPVFGWLSPLIVARRLAFFSSSLAQASLVGIAVGVWAGEPLSAPWAGLVGVTLLVALALVFVRRHSALPADTLTGVFLAVATAVGLIALVAVTRQFSVHQIEAVLFGSPVTVQDTDLVVMVLGGGVVVVVGWRLTRPILLSALDDGVAASRGLGGGWADYALAAVLACAVVVALRVVGALLVEALVVLPAASARGVTTSLRGWRVGAIVVAVVGCLAGLLASASTAAPAGAAMVLGMAVLFAVSLVLRFLQRLWGTRSLRG